MRNMLKTISAVGLSAVIAAGVLPVNAEETDTTAVTTKDESVYIVLNADGSTSEITVSDKLHNDEGFDNYEDISDLTDVQNLKSSDDVQETDNGLLWDTDETDIYYQGTGTEDLPIDTSITYTLDGKEVTAEDLLGQSGHLVMTISVSNHETKEYTVSGVTYTVCQPFYLIVGGYTDNDVFKNVTMDHGTVQDDSSGNIIAAVMMPGMKDSIGQFLTGDLESINDYFYDEITLEADVTDFESPLLMMAASTDISVVKEEFADTDIATDDLFDQLDELNEATEQLISGAKTLYEGADELTDGAEQLDEGASSLLEGTEQISSGSQQLYSGASSLESGAESLSSGISSLTSGLSQIVSQNSSLTSGAQQIADAILDQANSTLNENETITSDSGYVALTWDNYASQLGYYANITDSMRAAAKKEVNAQLEAAGVTLSDEQLDLVLYLAARDYSNDVTSALTNNTTAFTIASQASLAQSDAALTASGDYSKIDEVMNAAVYQSIIGTIESTTENLGVTVSDSQAEQILLAAVSQGITSFTDLSETETAALQTIVTEVVMSTDASASALGRNNDSIKAVIGALRSSYGDSTVYSSLLQTLSTMGISSDEAAVVLTYAGEYYSDKTTLGEMLTSTSSDLSTAASVQTNLSNSKTSEGQQLIAGLLNALVQSSSAEELAEIKELSTTLQQVAAFVEGVKAYTDATAQVYAGAQQLESGAQTLTEGASSLRSAVAVLMQGADSLESGAETLKDGTASLKDGASQISEGAETLYEGLVEYNDEGISKLTENSALDNLQTVSSLVTDMMDDDNLYDNYSGISEDTEGTVKFVYKISGVKAEETEKTTTDTEEEDDTSFWERIVNLFKF